PVASLSHRKVPHLLIFMQLVTQSRGSSAVRTLSAEVPRPRRGSVRRCEATANEPRSPLKTRRTNPTARIPTASLPPARAEFTQNTPNEPNRGWAWPPPRSQRGGVHSKHAERTQPPNWQGRAIRQIGRRDAPVGRVETKSAERTRPAR